MKIYTKTGDKGKTSLFDGTRVYKNNPRVETYGTVDELNSIIGIVIAESQTSVPNSGRGKSKINNTLIQIQNNLFEIGANLANPNKTDDQKLRSHLAEQTKILEQSIDDLTVQMPELTYFILPGGGKAGAFLQLARTVARRAERNIVTLNQQEIVEREILIYLNRLSDAFHTMSRYVNMMENKKETIWISQIK